MIQRYLLDCIRLGVSDEAIYGRWEASESLHVWFRHLVDTKEDSSVFLQRAARAVTDLFLTSGEEVRDAIETGFLEHALETAALRPYFEHWSTDIRLRESWDRALKWGKAHPDFTWGLLHQLRKTQE